MRGDRAGASACTAASALASFDCCSAVTQAPFSRSTCMHTSYFALSKVVPGTSMTSPARSKTQRLMWQGKNVQWAPLEHSRWGFLNAHIVTYDQQGRIRTHFTWAPVHTILDPNFLAHRFQTTVDNKVRTRTHSRLGVGSNECVSALPWRISSAPISCPLPSAPAVRGPQSHHEQLGRKLRHLSLGPCNPPMILMQCATQI